jgi:hypothetical protein
MKYNIKKIIIKILGEGGANKSFIVINKLRHLFTYYQFKLKFNEKKRNTKLKNNAHQIIESNNQNIFFGYDDTKILAISTKNKYYSAYTNDKAEILLIDLQSNNKEKITETETWNWQQGCRLQWHPNEKNKIIYNKIVEGKHGCEIYDTEAKRISKKIKFPLYDITNDGKYLISLNFSRLQRLRKGYGYSNFSDVTLNEKYPKSDGVWIYDIINDTKNLIISLYQL